MTEREQDGLHKTRMEVLQRAGFVCEVCGTRLGVNTVQLAHRIPQRKMWLNKYGKSTIHHPCNLVATCSEECNSRVSLGNSTEQHQQVLDEIMCYKAVGGWYEDE